MNDFTKIIPIGTTPALGDGLIDTVNARDLHLALGCKSNFRDWIMDRIETCKFKENEEFVIFAENSAKPGRPAKVCFLTLDAAKHFAMLERNDVGFAVRTSTQTRSRWLVPILLVPPPSCPLSFAFLFPAPQHQPHVQL